MSYRSLLRVAGPWFFPLGFLARLPYATSSLAILILLQTTTGSYAYAGAAGAAQCVAMALGGPMIGRLADRYGHRRVGALSAVANIAALICLIGASRSGRPAMLAAALLVGLTQPQVGPLVRVHWSRLLHAREQPGLLPAALSYESTADETGFIAGPVVVAVLAPVATPLGPVAPILATIALLALATLPFALLHADRTPTPHPVSARERTAIPRAQLAAMFLAMAAMGTVFGAVQTGVTAYAQAIRHPAAAGLLYADFGIGSALAGAAYAWLPRRFPLHRRYVVFAAALLGGTVIIPLGDELHSIPPAMALAGVTVAPYMITLYALTERLAPPAAATAAMTILSAGGPVGTAAGRALAGYLAEGSGSLGAFSVAPITAAGALLLALWVATADRGRGIWLGADKTLPES